MADATGSTDDLLLKMEEANMIDEIKKLQEHANDSVYNAAIAAIAAIAIAAIVDTWFCGDEIDENVGENQFSFAAPQQISQPFSF